MWIARIAYGGLMIFEKISTHIKNSHWKWLVIFVFTVAFAMSCIIFAEDYRTSYLGYIALPTRKALGGIVLVTVAFLPQVGQIVFAYLGITDENKRWAFLISAALFLVDWGLDVYYKAGPVFSFASVTVAMVESFVIFTLGSEVLMTVSAGVLLELLGPAFRSLMHALFPMLGPPKQSVPQGNKFKNEQRREERPERRPSMNDDDLELPRKPKIN